MNITKTVKVGGYVLKTKFVNMIDNGENGASISFCKNLIQIARYVLYIKLGKKVRTKISKTCNEQDFCHEIIHGIDVVYNGDTLTEKQVENLAKGLHQVIEDNPSVFKKKGGK